MKFKIGDKVRKRGPCTRFGPLGITEDTVTGLNYNHSHVYLKESFWQRAEELELVEEKEMTHKYEEGKWYMWDGKGDCPLHPEDKAEIKAFNTHNGDTENFSNPLSHTGWTHRPGFVKVFAFKITKKYQPAKKMTVAEISKALGYDVEIVKG